MRIQHNIMAMNAYRNYNTNTSALSKNLEKLSSGYKINRAGDDAAGLAISEKMRAQITGLNAAQKNVKDGISLVKTGEGAMQEIQDMLNRMDYLATQSANGTYDNEVDRLNLQKEVNALKTEINRIADSANFNGIKLLDGSLDRNVLATEAGVTTTSVDFAKGIDFEIGQGGGGSTGTYVLNVEEIFGKGDKLEVQWADKDGTAQATVEFNFGSGTNPFSGTDATSQAKSLADAMGKTALANNFNIEVDGSSVILKNKEEGNNLPTVTSFDLTNVDTTLDAAHGETKAGGDATPKGAKFEGLFDLATGAGKDFSDSDTLTLKVGDYSATIDLKGLHGKTANETAANIAKALNEAKFDNNPNTVADESLMKVGDLFNFASDRQGGLTVTPAGGGAQINSAGTEFGLTFSNDPANEVKSAAGADTYAAADAQKYEVKLDTNEAKDLTVGDKLTFKGTLSDGRKFQFTVEAGKDFEIDAAGADATTTFTNLKNLLETKGIELQDENGKTLMNGDTAVTSDKVFGTGKEFTLAAKATGIEVTSAKPGDPASKGVSSIESVELDAAPATSVDGDSLTPGAKQTGAQSTITFSDGLQYGATIDVDGQTYEIIKKGERTTNGKYVGVEIEDLSKTTDVASAFAKAFNDKAGADGKVTASASGNKVTLTTKEIGSTAVSPTVATAGDKVKQLEFTLDPNRVQEKSYVTINGQDYQFVSDKSKVDEGKTAVVVDFKNATSESLAAALKDVADGKNNATVTVEADGLIKIRGTENEDGEIVTPTASFHDGKGGLVLQIGDTADDFNQMNVSIGDMHTSALGIDGVNIGNQEGAKAAIDVIKNAINYVSGVRGDLGAIQNRLDHTANNLSVMAENIQDAESTIRDTDVAEEMMSYVKNNILVQSAQAMLAQANQVPQGVLQLLG